MRTSNRQLAVNQTKGIMLLLAIMGLIITACGGGNNGPSGLASSAAAQGQDAASGQWPEVLRVGVLPGEEEGKLSRGNNKFVEDLGEALGMKTELFVGDDYTAVIEAMRTKKIDIASFGPFAYIIAAERSGAIPFAVKATSLDAAFYDSWIVVPDESKAEKLEDLKGKTFLFSDPASTSGHLFPRAIFIDKIGITTEEVETYFANLSFSGGHDKSIMAVAQGAADGAGVCSSCVQKVIDAGLVKESDFRIIAKSDPIPTSPYTYRKDLPADLVAQIQDFMFNYHTMNPDPNFFAQGTQQFYPIGEDAYEVVRMTARALNLSPEELLK